MKLRQSSKHTPEFAPGIVESTQGPQGLDIRNLYLETDAFTFDPGFKNTAVCESSICYIDGDAGILQYRGYDIASVVKNLDYLSTFYLLAYGEVPSQKQKKKLIVRMKSSMTPQLIKVVNNLIQSQPQTSHPMAVIMTVLASLSGQQASLLASNSPETSVESVMTLMPYVVAAAIRHFQTLALPSYQYTGRIAEDFLTMLTDQKPSPESINIVDQLLILHADHEQNASTSTVRAISTTGANLFSALTSGVAALWGPAHGGANEACVNMLEDIGDAENVPNAITKAIDRQNNFRIMGFGHRVYKNYDPRAKILKSIYQAFITEKKNNHKLFSVALTLEEQALKHPYFVSHQLYPNVDFYSGITQLALGIPKEAFTCFFLLGRTAGWLSHWLEISTQPEKHPIVRPRQIYTGHPLRDFD